MNKTQTLPTDLLAIDKAVIKLNGVIQALQKQKKEISLAKQSGKEIVGIDEIANLSYIKERGVTADDIVRIFNDCQSQQEKTVTWNIIVVKYQDTVKERYRVTATREAVVKHLERLADAAIPSMRGDTIKNMIPEDDDGAVFCAVLNGFDLTRWIAYPETPLISLDDEGKMAE